MRIAVLSDIHANFQALTSVLDDINANKVDEILSLGDNIGYGPQPEEVVTTLRKLGVLSIMGNHELALAKPSYFAALNPDPQKSLALQRTLMRPESIKYCTALPPLMLRHNARFIHGCPPRSITSYLVQPSMTKMKRIFSGYPEQFCFFGHLHTLERYILDQDDCRHEQPEPGRYQYDPENRYLFNPGSVGQPRDEFGRKAKYAIWDTGAGSLEIRAVAYDRAAVKQLLQQRGFPKMNRIRL